MMIIYLGSLYIHLPISTNRFRTLRLVFAEVSMKMISFSRAYCCASSVCTYYMIALPSSIKNDDDGDDSNDGDDIHKKSTLFIDKPVVTFRLDSISALFPARAMTTLGSPLRCSSFTHDLAPLKESY